MSKGQSNVVDMRRPGRRRTTKLEDNQPDFFMALPSDIPVRDQQDLMERPFFSLSKNKRTEPLEYRVGENYIRVTANEEHGIATIWDADVLIWAASQITEALNRGMKTSRFFHLSAYQTPRKTLPFRAEI